MPRLPRTDSRRNVTLNEGGALHRNGFKSGEPREVRERGIRFEPDALLQFHDVLGSKRCEDVGVSTIEPSCSDPVIVERPRIDTPHALKVSLEPVIGVLRSNTQRCARVHLLVSEIREREVGSVIGNLTDKHRIVLKHKSGDAGLNNTAGYFTVRDSATDFCGSHIGASVFPSPLGIIERSIDAGPSIECRERFNGKREREVSIAKSNADSTFPNHREKEVSASLGRKTYSLAHTE